ncbi:hypothetical protein ABEB36_003944 [Hypothenemus hampei]|uniref:Lipase n=1 Tax=Hypothenemus hampei TaxID=57062 RepID=A0ABD1F1M8_HYPHA
MRLLVIVFVVVLQLCFYVKGDYEEIFRKIQGIFSTNKVKTHRDDIPNITDFLMKYNYSVEIHQVQTQDGFNLTVHRIPKSSNTSAKFPLIFAHCLACSSMDWIWQGPSNSLPLILADLDYDIWLANMRGNGFSMSHLNFTSKDPKFWDYSFHEKGHYDMASTVDYVLNVTGKNKIIYVGHSQGTTAGIVLTTTRPEYNTKIDMMVLLSPIVYLEHMNSPLVRFLADYNNIITTVLKALNIHGIPYAPLLNQFAKSICNENSSLQGICILLIELFAGFDVDQIDKFKLPTFLSNTPSGVSVKEVEHLIQGINSGSFRQYDYGNALSNIARYGTSEPPQYDLNKLTVPLAIYYAKNDFLASTKDVERFISTLTQDTVDRYLIDYELFNHLDFITAKDVKKILYDRIVEVLKKRTSIEK